ncbi:tripartite tricarboxylate transporter permease [Martelella mediterranea]|uniref:tripartite tricarboxylate transporter permease n=1 Tax=Martelella mediterranea TaxID=293089 RepID=UPI001E56A9E8|nr:tripartite tricarboxylate transporter permease [Martelella mediterranea]MCD1634926.1 tripartite tricarboxylate transporter permease [Martelella mediterranea]
MFETVITAFSDAFTVQTLVLIFAGVFIGQIFGAIPGLSALTAIAIAVPLTYYFTPVGALAFLVSINKGGTVGGAVSAILMNTPGTPEAAATAFDGHPLAKQGKGLKALKMALFSSVTGDSLSDFVLFAVSAPLALIAIKMGPTEMLAVIVFALTIIASLVGKSMFKGLIAAFLGLLLATVGLDPEGGTSRFIFGMPDLMDGLPISAVGIGVLAMAEVLRQLVMMRGANADSHLPFSSNNPQDKQLSWAEFRGCLRTILRSAAIGTGIGALPGIGSSAAAFISYNAAVRASKRPETFGKGNIEGIAAAEAANSSVVGANFIPLLSIGIPGNVAAALILGAFIVHGIQPGPNLMHEQGRLVYGMFAAMVIANMTNLLLGYSGLRIFALAARAPARVVFPVIGLICLTGAYLTSGTFGLPLVVGFAVIGLVMRQLDFSFVTFIIGFVLGPSFELAVRQTAILSDATLGYFFDRPIAMLILALAAFTLVRSIWKHVLRSRKNATA